MVSARGVPPDAVLYHKKPLLVAGTKSATVALLESQKLWLLATGPLGIKTGDPEMQFDVVPVKPKLFKLPLFAFVV